MSGRRRFDFRGRESTNKGSFTLPTRRALDDSTDEKKKEKRDVVLSLFPTV